VCYGRGVGYDIEEIKLEDAIEAISASKLRKEGVKLPLDVDKTLEKHANIKLPPNNKSW